MAATTSDRNTPKRDRLYLHLGVNGAEKIPTGVLVARDATGYAVNAADAVGVKVLGRSNAEADNTDGADGDIGIEIERGVFLFGNDVTNPVTIASIGENCFVKDNQTVDSDGGINVVVAGRVHDVTAEGVWVDTYA